MRVCYYVFLSDGSLLIWYIKMELKYQQCFNLLTCIQYSHSPWFLDGRTSILVLILIVFDSS